jgi:hypothetical protein
VKAVILLPQTDQGLHLVKLELLSNATTIDSALSYSKQQKGLALESTNNQPETSGRQAVF